MSDNIKVVVKVRPLISREIEDKLSYQWRVKNNTLYQLDQNGKDLGQSFTFDKVYDKDTKTTDVYDDIAKPIVQAATAGFNGTIFAYGQTSSGKTFTMTGTDKSPGIIPLSIINLFEIIKNVPDRDFLVRVSYIEIYNETVKDLLNVDNNNIKIKETLQGIKVDATEKVTSSPEEVLEAMKEGELNRQKGATNMNEQSSRSHSIFQVIIESREHIEGEEEPGCVNVSQLNLVDLAGSERSGQTGATGLRFIESTHINKSLSALALVIKQLSEDNKYTNYRDSKLTRILQNSLGGNAKTSIICAITPAAVEETISTLQFANRAKAIKNKPEVNAVATADSTMIQRLTKQMCKLQAQLESKKNLEEDNYKLQSKIQNLQKLILNGFAQRRSVELISGTRRKLQPPRRITISSLHSISDDEPVVTIPKFCTPSLKYNPNAIPNPDFKPLVTDKLPVVPEEPRLVTPPPIRTVFFSNEVIELDSDDDESTRDDVQTCSPVHKCYGATKTPPCVLRRNAKEAEKNLKGIIELTEREKLYSPNVVEYIEKLEHNTTVIAKLQDQMEIMHRQSKEKDLEVEHLKSKIRKTEEEMKLLTVSKTELQSQCNNYSTKLTDAEVSYETLRNKAKLREEELLSLLEELTAKTKKVDDIGKVLSRTLDKELHFMDISKDISLVNSDNENSKDEESEHMNELLAETQSELCLKNQAVIQLEADIFAQQQKISALENTVRNLQAEITTSNEKLSLVDCQNSLLKSTIDTLNSTIKSQKENLETAKNDIDSYNSLIQELQIKVTQKENLPTIEINDSVLENMIANEEKFIANNENMKNIIHSLKIALDARTKEINQLKTSLQAHSDVTQENVTLTEQLESKTKEIDNLHKQIKDNATSINKLMYEKDLLKTVEQQLMEKIASLEDKTSELEKLNSEVTISAEKLREENLELTSVADIEKETAEMNKQLLLQIENMSEQISQLETEMNQKDDLISSLTKEDEESKENLLKAKAAIIKSQLILSTLSGNMQEVPEMVDNLVNAFNVLSNNLDTLGNIANNVVKHREESSKSSDDLKIKLEELTSKYNSEISTLREQLDILSTRENSRNQENITLSEKVNHLDSELETSRKELLSKISENHTLEDSLKEATETLKTYNERITNLNAENAKLDQTLVDMKNAVENLTGRLEENERILQEKILEAIVDITQERDELLQSIYKKITEFTISYNIQNDIRGEIANDCSKIHECILLTLDKIGSHITFISLKNVDDDNTKANEILLEAKNEIVELTQHNLSLVQQLSDVESKCSELTIEITKIQNDNKQLNKELSVSNEILQSLQVEVRSKADELTSMEGKVRDWKEQFKNLECITKQQMDEIKLENENLKADLASIQNESKLNSIITYEHKDSYDIAVQVDTDKKQNLVPDSSSSGDLSSPPSLLTICCNRIVDSINPKETESNTTTVGSNKSLEENYQNNTNECKCKELSLALEAAKEENSEIIELLEQIKAVNQYLIQEHEEARSEIQQLVAPALELQKKVINHKTNLSILTATTTAENRALKSQVKGLQHHHSRFHNVCQRDIPDFKKQLQELMVLLRGDPSIADPQNASFKRYSLPDVLDSSTALPNFKNESTLDGDLLMLDTNITVTTAADNTLTGHDQTCLDMTQYYNEPACELTQMEIISLGERLNILKDENAKLRELVNRCAGKCSTDPQITSNHVDNHKHINEDDKNGDINALNGCDKCKKQGELQLKLEEVQHNLKLLSQELLDTKSQKDDIEQQYNNLILETRSSDLQRTLAEVQDKLKALSQELLDIKSLKEEIEQKYNNLVLETPSSELLIKKLSKLEKDNDIKNQEINKLTNSLTIKGEQIKSLQEENDTLSTQVMENISEADDLNKELEEMKKVNTELLEKCSKLEQTVKGFSDKQLPDNCTACLLKDDLIKTLELRITHTNTKLNRSLSDSDTSSRYNKICTLRSELDASREDCKEITEDMVTIKNHLERSNLSMDLDDSMGESNTYTSTKDFVFGSPQSRNCIMPDIAEEQPIDIYTIDKIDCYNYYAEKLGIRQDHNNSDMRIIDLMKMFYEHLITKHGNEVENLTNKLKDYVETKTHLESQISRLQEKQAEVTINLQQKDQNYNDVVKVLSQIRSNINILNQEITQVIDVDVIKLVNMYKDNFFKVLDNELGLSSVQIIETIIDKIVNKHQTDLNVIIEPYTKLQVQMESVSQELSSVTENLEHMKGQLSAKEDEYNLLKKQKERIHEISSAVTLDIVQKDKELSETITNSYKKLVELNIVTNEDIDLTLPPKVNIEKLFEHISQHKISISSDIEKKKENLASEINNLKHLTEEKQKEIEEIKLRNQYLQEINNTVTKDLVDTEEKLREQSALHQDLSVIYENKMKENEANVHLIEKLTEEVNLLKGTIDDKEKAILKLEMEIKAQNECKSNEVTELVGTVTALRNEIAHLKSLNEAIVKEKDSYASELLKSGETLKQNNIEMDKMTSDILVLRESVRENGLIVENLNTEAKNLLKKNMELKEQLEDKCRECYRLETNIKTHEKTAEIQTRMIMRLEKQKSEDDKTISEKTKQIEELKQKDCLQKNCKDEIDLLKKSKESLEARVTELEELLGKSHQSIDALADSSRRRRQSLYDSKRQFGEDQHQFGDHNNVEAMFEARAKPDDLFLDAEEDVSNRSSPSIRLSKGRDSLSLSKTDQDEEPHSRPSSVVATRRRRQSIHDLHRSVLRHTPSPGLDASNRIIDEFNHSKPSDTSGDAVSELTQLRDRLTSCQQELAELKEKYKELDEECETCAEYLRERDEQCARLKKEKAALQTTISDLKEKLQSCHPNESQQIASKPSVTHIGVNTDEDWTNLHSVVVDRMSFDAEVEKNKKLTKTIEELRFKKQDLKNTLAKMQKALDKHTNNRELHSTRQELQACKQELIQLREKYKELDEECETCAQYLREKEEQCRRLKEAKTALQTKLQELEGHNTPHSTRKKRQSLHDQNRPSTVDVNDASTETCDDLLSYQVERDGSVRHSSEDKQGKEIKQLKSVVEKLSQQKLLLEQQLVGVSSMQQLPMYVATGSAIVQNQQLTDVMKENQKLKKINAKLVNICKKRGRDSNRENEDPADRG